MKEHPFNRLQRLRMDNDAVKFEMDAERGRFEKLRSRHEDGTAPRAVSAFNLFQTPPALAARMAALLPADVKRILEPSAGLGRLYTAAKATHAAARIDTIERDSDCCDELRRLGAQPVQQDFLTVEPAPIYNAVIMNPPFHNGADIKHVLHAFKFLTPDGVLVGLCLTGQRRDKLRGLCDYWEELPRETFKAEGTQVSTALFTLTK